MARSLSDWVGVVFMVPSCVVFAKLARTRTIIPHNPAKYGKIASRLNLRDLASPVGWASPTTELMTQHGLRGWLAMSTLRVFHRMVYVGRVRPTSLVASS